MFVRSFVTFGFASSLCGLSCMDFLLLLLDPALAEPLLSLKSWSYAGLVVPVLDFLHLGLVSLLQGFGRCGFLASASSCARSGSMMPISDSLHPDLVPFLQSFSKMGFVMPTLDFLHLGLLPFARSYICIGFALSVIGLTRVGFVFALSVLDSTWSGSSLSVRSLSQFDLAMFVSDLLHLDLITDRKSVV